MDRKKQLYGFLAVLVFISCMVPGYALSKDAGDQAGSLSFPLPLLEINDFIVKWYEQNGYRVERFPLEMGCIRLSAEGETQKIAIYLTPDSPIGVKVSWDKPLNDPFTSALVQEIHAYLDGDAAHTENRPEIKREEGSVPEALQKKMAAVVCIKSSKAKDQNRFSGFVIDRKGRILSTAHGLANGGSVTLYVNDGRVLNGKILRIDFKRDLALIQASQKIGDAVISLVDERDLPGMGEPLYAIGCPEEAGVTLYSGVINGLPVKVNGIPLLQVDMPIYPGNSGSPVFDSQGRLVAMVKARFKGSEAIGFLMPLLELTAFLEEE